MEDSTMSQQHKMQIENLAAQVKRLEGLYSAKQRELEETEKENILLKARNAELEKSLNIDPPKEDISRQQPQTTTAGSQLAEIPELLEQIFTYQAIQDPRSLLTKCIFVNRRFRDLIESSTAVRQHMGLKTEHGGKPPIVAPGDVLSLDHSRVQYRYRGYFKNLHPDGDKLHGPVGLRATFSGHPFAFCMPNRQLPWVEIDLTGGQEVEYVESLKDAFLLTPIPPIRLFVKYLDKTIRTPALQHGLPVWSHVVCLVQTVGEAFRAAEELRRGHPRDWAIGGRGVWSPPSIMDLVKDEEIADSFLTTPTYSRLAFNPSLGRVAYGQL